MQADPLFQGLARPTMIAGVSYLFFLVNSTVCLFSFIWAQNFLILFIVGPSIHAIGYLICMNEPIAVELAMLRLNKGTKCVNRRYHGYTNSYDIF